VIVRDRYGRPKLFKTDKDVLGPKAALTPLSEFYAFGSTRLGLIDILLIIAIFGALIVPLGHITLRVITRSWRKRIKR
jgi:hypothetical protein